MTDKEIIQALRCGEDANGTPRPEPSDGEIVCYDPLKLAAADLIERLTAEIVLAQRKQAEAEAERDALIEQIKERHDCMDCKHNDYCEFDDANVIDCMNCVKGNCPCAQCCDSSRWEWRGLPEAPEEVLPKDKADEIALKLMRLADLESLCNYTRLRELAAADKAAAVIDAIMADWLYWIKRAGELWVLTRDSVEEMEGKKDGNETSM